MVFCFPEALSSICRCYPGVRHTSELPFPRLSWCCGFVSVSAVPVLGGLALAAAQLRVHACDMPFSCPGSAAEWGQPPCCCGISAFPGDGLTAVRDVARVGGHSRGSLPTLSCSSTAGTVPRAPCSVLCCVCECVAMPYVWSACDGNLR